MAGKPDLSSAPGVQNVVVYVSNDNFAQAYTVGQQNVPANLVHNPGYGTPQPSVAPMVATTKTFSDKQSCKSDYSSTTGEQVVNNSSVPEHQQGYFASVISQNGYTQPLVNDLSYQNGGAVLKNYENSDEVLSVERQAGPARPDIKVRDECDNRDGMYVEQPAYMTVMGAEVPSQSVVRCDSVRSEAAESSCSSLSSADEGLLVVQQNQQAPPPSEMLVYEDGGGVNIRSTAAGVVLTVGPAPLHPQQTQNSSAAIGTLNSIQKVCVTVPHGWKRLLNNGSVVYISPSNTVLSSLEQVKEYLLSAGTCKCGLECHFKYDNVFNFDTKVVGKPWILLPDSNTGDMTKLCNHKRKIIAMASMGCKPPDHNVKMQRREYIKRGKRKMGLPYSGVSQIPPHRGEKIALNQHSFNKDLVVNSQQVFPQIPVNNQQQPHHHRFQNYHDPRQNPLHPVRYQDPQGNRVMATAGSSLVLGDGTVMLQQANNTSGNNISTQQMPQNHHIPQTAAAAGGAVNIQSHQIIGPNGQIINVQGTSTSLGSNLNQQQQQQQMVQAQNVVQSQQELHQQQHRIFINSQPNEPTGPGRPNIQMVPVSVPNQQQRHQHQQQLHHQQQQQQQMQFYGNHPAFPHAGHPYDPTKNVRPFGQMMQGFRQHGVINHQQQQQQQLVQTPTQMQQNQRMQWHPNRLQQQQVISQQQQQQQQQQQHLQSISQSNICERVPPLHQHTPPPTVWPEEIKRKKMKLNKVGGKSRPPYHLMDGGGPPTTNHSPCPNIDVRQIPIESTSSSGSSRAVIINQFPQNNQNGASSSPSFMEDPSGYLAQQTALLNSTINRQTGANGCTGYVCNSPVSSIQSPQQQHHIVTVSQQVNEVPLPSNLAGQQVKIQAPLKQQQINFARNQQPQQNVLQQQYPNMADSSAISDQQQQHQYSTHCHCCASESAQQQQQQYQNQKISSRASSTSGTPNSSSTLEDPVTSSTYSEQNKHFNHTSPDSRPIQGGTVSTSNDGNASSSSSNPPTPTPPQRIPDSVALENACCSYTSHRSGLVTTMASGRTVGSNTITSVLAGRANTATVSINVPASSSPPSSFGTAPAIQTQAVTVGVSKSPLEMVQSVVSSIQVPQQQIAASSPHHHHHIIKHSPTTGLSPGHIFVSSGGQLIMASTAGGGQQSGMMAPPPPPKLSVSPMVTTNVTGSMIPQQMLGQQTVLVQAAPFVLQPGGVTMTMDGMQNMQLPQLVAAGNVIQQQIQLDGSDVRRLPAMLSPEAKKKVKRKKGSPQTVASMLHIAAAQQNSGGMVMSQQQGGFPAPQQIQMSHSPQGIATAPMMQALTIVPSKNGGPAQLVMNGNTSLGAAQQLINSQPTQQINLLQPVNLINGATGVVQNFPAIQQFILPNLGGMVMNPDGTATLLQDTSNLGMQLQIQHVNGQNVLTPVQNNSMFNGGQSILAAGPAGMVIRAPAQQGKILQHQQQQQQQHSPGAQFLSPNGGQFVVNGTQFGGQLSPLVASMSPNQQVTFGAPPQQLRNNASGGIQPQQQEYIQMNGQTLMVPCSPAAAASSSSQQQNTTFVQQNTTIVQQQTTMVANNQQLHNFQHGQQQQQQARTLNMEQQQQQQQQQQNYIVSSNDNKQMQAVVVQQQRVENPHASSHNYKQSVSTQTAVNQNAQSVTTNTSFCQTSTISAAGSPPDTTTLSPLPMVVAAGGQSPPTADTTTHSGSTDDGLSSPAPSNCSASCSDVNVQSRPQSCTMAMVHCISSSEPDSADLNPTSEMDWRRSQQSGGGAITPKTHYGGDAMHFSKRSTPTPYHHQIAFAESSTLVSGMQQYVNDVQLKAQDAVVSSRNYEREMQQKRKSGNDGRIDRFEMDVHHHHHHHRQTALFDDEDEDNEGDTTDNNNNDDNDNEQKKSFALGDLVWGPTKGCRAWPGKIIQLLQHDGRSVRVRWFGAEKGVTEIECRALQTLTEGLDAHHQARKKIRTSRKLNGQLETAIQEAMAELDKTSEGDAKKAVKVTRSVKAMASAKKTSVRLKSGHH